MIVERHSDDDVYYYIDTIAVVVVMEHQHLLAVKPLLALLRFILYTVCYADATKCYFYCRMGIAKLATFSKTGFSFLKSPKPFLVLMFSFLDALNNPNNSS